MDEFSIKIESTLKGFTKEQIEKWAKEVHGENANIDIEEVDR